MSSKCCACQLVGQMESSRKNDPHCSGHCCNLDAGLGPEATYSLEPIAHLPGKDARNRNST